MNRLTLFTILLAFIFPFDSQGNEFGCFTNIDMRHGLSESRVRALHALPDGSIAVATSGTIDLFDGCIFKNTEIQGRYAFPLIGYHGFREITHTPDSILWLKNNGTLHAFNLHDLTPVSDIHSLFSSYGIKYEPDNIYVAGNRFFTATSDGELYCYDGKTNRFLTRLPQNNHKNDTPQKLTADSSKVYLCYDDGRVDIINNSNGQYIYSGTVPGSGDITEYNRGINIGIHDRKLFISRCNREETVSELNILDTGTFHWDETIRIPFRVSGFDFDEGGNCVIVGNGGYIVLSPSLEIVETSSEIRLPHGKLMDDFSAIATIPSGSMWFGTVENGILYSNSNRRYAFIAIPENTSFPSKRTAAPEKINALIDKHARGITNCFASDSVGNIYLGTREGIMIFTPKSELYGIIDDRFGLPSSNIQSLLATSSEVWASTSCSISRITPTNGTIVNDSIATFTITNYGILDGVDLNGKEFRTQQMKFDSLGHIIVGYPGGIYLFHPDSVRKESRPSYLFPGNQSHLSITEEQHPERFIPLTVVMFLLVCLVGLPFRPTPNKQPDVTDLHPAQTNHSNYNNAPLPAVNDFITKLTNLIIENIENSELSVSQLSGMMAMERTVLYRKTQLHLKMSPSTYIKSIRIREACRLLCDTDLLIADISYRTGFSSPKYFAQTFKDATSFTPSDYRRYYREHRQ